MDRWSGKVALVTGAGSGIGAAISKELVKNGLKVVGIDKNFEAVESVAKETELYSGKFHPLKTDVCVEDEILTTFTWIKDNLGGVDILINSAGVLGFTSLIELSPDALTRAFNVNIIGLSICTREAIKSMRERAVDGHVININSLLGHRIEYESVTFPYTASKHALGVLTEGLRHELKKAGIYNIKVTSVSPGPVDSPMFKTFLKSIKSDENSYPWITLQPQDIANAIIYILGTPSHVQIQELMLCRIHQKDKERKQMYGENMRQRKLGLEKSHL